MKNNLGVAVGNFILVLVTILGCLYLYSPLNPENKEGSTSTSAFVYQQF